MNELISIIIPLFNKEDYIARAITSVLRQSYENFELIIIDDGSTDRSADIVRSFKDLRIKFVHQENEGVSSARNQGIKEARADLIAFLDADDAYEPSFLEMIMNLRSQYPQAGAYATNYMIIEPNDRTRVGTHIPSNGPPRLLDVRDFFKLSLHGSVVCSSAVAVKKTVFDQVGGFPLGVKLGEDLDTWIRIVFSYPIAFDAGIGSTYFKGAAQSLCSQLPNSCDLYFFQTIDELCSHQPHSQEELNHIREFKNLFRLIYAIQQIQEFSPSEGRKVLLACQTRFFGVQKWRWILTSLLPRKFYNVFRVFKKNMISQLSPLKALRIKV